MNDLETAKRIAAGDAVAAEKLVRDHYPSVFRLMRNLTGHREDAEDLTQQAFLSARANIRSFRGTSGLRTWLHRIAFSIARRKSASRAKRESQPHGAVAHDLFFTLGS